MNRKLALFLICSIVASVGLAQPPDNGQPPEAPSLPSPEQMQARMLAMQALMARIHATEDPAERARLMQEHMQSMGQGMAMMNRMMRSPMSAGAQCKDGDTQCQMSDLRMRQQMMGQGMGMMQMMMQQLMDHIGETDAHEGGEQH